MFPWGSFPKNLRRYFIAQNGRCPYCARVVEFTSSIKAHERIKPNRVVPSTEHVRPKSRGHTADIGNKVLACVRCNNRKGGRQPYPCEILFAEITGEIVLATLPPADLKCYLGRQQQAKDAAANEQCV